MWSDVESSQDYLNFGEVSELAVEILSSKDMLPTSIGIFGHWGAGKSSLLKLIEMQVTKNESDYIVINFDAWLYQGFDDAKSALLEVIATKLMAEIGDNESLIEKGQELLKRINIFRSIGLLAEGVALASGVPTGGFISRTVETIGKVSDGIQDEKEFNEAKDITQEGFSKVGGLFNEKTTQTPPQLIHEFRKEYGELLKALNKPVIVIIDNLDRCLPANAIHTLEAIRLFLFLDNTAFIIAADEVMIKTSVASYFKGSSSQHQLDYIDKLIQIPIRVPKAGVREIRAYLFMLYAIDHGLDKEMLDKLREALETDLKLSWKQEPISIKDLCNELKLDDEQLEILFFQAERIAPILANSPKINANPRTVKRLLNVVKMRSLISKRRAMHLDESIIIKLVILERCIDTKAVQDFYRAIEKENGFPSLLKQLENNDSDINYSDVWSKADQQFTETWCKLEPTLADVDLRGAVYLSRETIPIGSYSVSLSPQAKEALKVLLETKNTASTAAKETLSTLAPDDKILIMEQLIIFLRKISNWSTQPEGLIGAKLLAEDHSESGTLLARFLHELNVKEPWLDRFLKSVLGKE